MWLLRTISAMFIATLFASASPILARAEDPSAAAVRFYQEYMGSGVALKLFGDRWFTSRFKSSMALWDNDPLQKPIEGNPILPWKNWDMTWRDKLQGDVLQATPERALVLITFAKDEQGRSIARLVNLEKVAGDWRVDDVTASPH